ncbi:MAG: response regulator transcription factor [Saprospiraceae bacterium]|nr:response regulator transcription factor [Saprospiraceae bacterium]
MQSIRTVIVDDELPARNRLRKLLEQQPDFQAVAIFADGDSAFDYLNKNAVDLAFLDIQMPGLNGLELVRALPKERCPVIVFVTAFDQYALDAFEVFALGYLLKPFDTERFQETLKRVTNYLGHQSVYYKQLAHFMQFMNTPEGVDNQEDGMVSIKIGNRYYRLKINEIEYICSAGNYCELYAKGVKHLIREKISTFEALPNQSFIRIHKSTVINLHFAKELISLGLGEYEIKMSDQKKLKVSRNYKDNILHYFNVIIK